MLCHDPRLSDDRDHKVETDNPALLAAEMSRQAGLSVNWERVKQFADYADEQVPYSN